jgi:hypothetical protein
MAKRSVSARPARPDEGGALTELSLRAKGHWGYDAGFLELARPNLTIDADTIRSARIYVVERDGATIGFYGLLGKPPKGRLEWMFLEPEAIGYGYGRWMWSDAMQAAKAAGFTELLIESDRFAEPFYSAMGATRIGATASPVDGAPLPLFKVETATIGFVPQMRTIILRGGIEVENSLQLALAFLEAYSSYDAGDSSGPTSFREIDLRLANRGGARISAAEIAAILERRGRIERGLREIHPAASLVGPMRSIPWNPLGRLFDAFADIRGVGFSKMTKALHRKRPALIPMLDSVVQAYLTRDDDLETRSSESFGTRATALVRSYKRDLDRNHSVLREIQRELASRGYELTEVRILDLLIWSAEGADS